MFRLLVLAALVLCGQCYEDLSFVEENGRVVGGSNSAKNAWPWQVSLQHLYEDSWYHICGGSLIRTNWVLTAAHCVDDNGFYRVVLGEHNLNANDGTEQTISVSQIIQHSNWIQNNASNGYDIAVLHLASNVVLNNYVKLAVLPTDGAVLANNHTCILTGWGATSTSGGSLPSILQQVSLPVVANAICSTSFFFGSNIKTSMVCAGGDGVRSGCYGDSGGPLNCGVNGVYQVHGVDSFVSSLGCNAYLKPTVFTRVSAYISWINANAK